MEDKQLICDLFLTALQQTRNLDDLQDLKYDPETEMVTAVFPSGKKKVNVAGDSGTAMMQDILNKIIGKEEKTCQEQNAAGIRMKN